VRILRAIAQRIRTASPRTVLAAGFLFLFLYAYPGQMTTDTFDHLNESRSGHYTDSHPPAVNLVYRLCELVIGGQFGVLILQGVTFLVGLYLVFRQTFTPRAAAWAATLVFVFPPVFLPFAAVWKDTVMAGFLILGFALLLDPRRSRQLGGLGLLMAGTAMRYNALAATAPLVVLLFEWRPGMRWFARYPIAFAAWLVITLSAFTLNAKLTDQPMHFWHSSLAVFDIGGTLTHVDREIPDAELEQLFEGTGLLVHENIHATIKQLHDPRSHSTYVTDPKHRMWDLPIYGTTPAPQAQRDAVERVWREVLSTYPREYLAYRLDVMAEVLSLTRARPAGVVPKRELKHAEFAYAQHVPTGWSRLQQHMSNTMSSLWYGLPIFVPWLYCVIALVLLPLTRRHRDVFAILASGLAIEASLFVLAPSPDYRYSHWTILMTVIGIVVLTARRRRGQKAWIRPAATTQQSAESQASAQ
jgi:hypothetical protein